MCFLASIKVFLEVSPPKKKRTAKAAMIGFHCVAWKTTLGTFIPKLLQIIIIRYLMIYSFKTHFIYFKCTKSKGDFYWDLAAPATKRLAHPLLSHNVHPY